MPNDETNLTINWRILWGKEGNNEWYVMESYKSSKDTWQYKWGPLPSRHIAEKLIEERQEQVLNSIHKGWS